MGQGTRSKGGKHSEATKRSNVRRIRSGLVGMVFHARGGRWAVERLGFRRASDLLAVLDGGADPLPCQECKAMIYMLAWRKRIPFPDRHRLDDGVARFRKDLARWTA